MTTRDETPRAPRNSIGADSSRRRPADDSSESGGGGNGKKTDLAKDFKEHLDKCRKGVESLLRSACERVLQDAITTTGKNADPSAQTVTVNGVFEWAVREAVELVEAMGDQNKLTARDSLKAQEAAMNFKLATARKAGSVQLNNQAASLEAAAEVRIKEKVNEARGEGGSALVKALAQVEELEEELQEKKLKHQGDQDQLVMVKSLLVAEQDKTARLEEEVHERPSDLLLMA